MYSSAPAWSQGTAFAASTAGAAGTDASSASAAGAATAIAALQGGARPVMSRNPLLSSFVNHARFAASSTDKPRPGSSSRVASASSDPALGAAPGAMASAAAAAGAAAGAA